MRITRRAAASALALPFMAASCQRGPAASEGGASYPARDITFIIPVAAGGGFDILSRFIGNAMEPDLPRRVNVVPFNVASGGGGKGANMLYRAAPDGYTVGIVNIPGIFVLQRIRRLPYDFSDLAWIGTVTLGNGYGIAVRSKSSIRTFDDLVALSRRRPVTFAATGPEGSSHLATKIATRALGIRARIVSGYRSSTDYSVGAMRGDTDAVIAALGTLDRLPDGLRVIASLEATSDRPGVPSAVDLGHPELADLKGLRAVAAPPGTPPEAVAVLNHALTAAGRDRTVRVWAEQNDSIVEIRSPEETAALVRNRRDMMANLGDVD
ncbi:MAG: tripartite tricarboxylate transporter substrate binding protein [Hyphomonadaceae bacterium]|nr:tripartite tricarboxylate transporter substrate binding protein [Hyphomonadaceae bacterium]